MDKVIVNVPQESIVWVFPLIYMVCFFVFAVAYIKTAKGAAAADEMTCGEVAACVGCAVCGVATGVMSMVMFWHLFARSLQLPGY